MKHVYTTIKPILWVTAVLVYHSQIVSSSGAASPSQISQQMISSSGAASPSQISQQMVSSSGAASPSQISQQMVSSSGAASPSQISQHMVNSSGAASPTQIPQQIKQKIMVDFDVGLTVVDSIKQKISNNRKTFQRMQCKKCRQKDKSGGAIIIILIEEAAEVTPFMRGVAVAGTVVKIFFSFEKGKKMQEKFDTLNGKLDDISREINSLRDELKASIEFNDWLTVYFNYETNIRAGEMCLNDTLNEMKSETDEKRKMKLANDFLTCFEDSEIEKSAQAIYRLTGKPPSPTSQNLFELFVKEKGCDVLEISRLMMIIRDLMASAAKQSLVYYFFKDGNENRVGKSLTKYQSYLYDIRDYYNNQAWHCFRDSVQNAKSAAEKVIDDNKEVSTSLLSSIINEKLSSLIPWYSWTVAEFEKNEAPSVTVHPIFSAHSVTFTAEGETYFLIQEYTSSKRNVLVVWQDSEDVFRSCDNIDISSTKVYFKPCEECNSRSFVNSDNMIEEHTCNEFLKNKVYKAAHDKHFNPNGVVNNLANHPVSFVSANIGSHIDACINNACLNEGICKHINYTNTRFCMCKPFFEGINCENDIGNSLADNVTYVLGKLREHFGITTGIPDIIDIYYQINDLASDIKNIQQSLSSYSEYANLVSLYGKSIKDAEYISNYYHDFQTGKLELQNFGKRIDKFDIDYILLDFGQMITGDAILVADDFLTSKKKIWSEELGACTEEYYNATTSLMRNLVTLDQVVVESMIWHARWKISNTLSVAKKKSIISDVYQTYEYAIERQKLYFDNWNSKSCPKLDILNAKLPGKENIYCDKGLSYEGLSVVVQCMDFALKTSNDHNVTCSMNDATGALEWLGKPECNFATVWSNWTEWSECSVTCDTGVQIQYRRSTNGQIQNQTQQCNMPSCCTSAGGILCNGDTVCIRPEQQCDGNNDCGNNEDESDDCRYLRVGDTVALKSLDNNHWLSCYKGNKGHKCTGDKCGSTTMNGDDWQKCYYEVFDYIAAENRLKGQAIRHGDRVAILYGSGGYWLTCQGGDRCVTHNCPGSSFEDNEYSRCIGEVYWILSEARTGSCTFSTSPGCIGEPIQPKDTIHLLHVAEGTGQWVSMCNDKKPRLRPCDVRNNPVGCACERWEIYPKRYFP